MFPEAMNSIDSKKVSELWEEEKKYRWWIIGFAASLVLLFAFNLVLVIMAFILKDDLITHFRNFYLVTSSNPQVSAENEFLQITLFSITTTVAFFISSLVFIYSVFNSYKVKSFEKLDSFSSFYIAFQSIFSIIGLIRLLVILAIGDNVQLVFGNNFMIFYSFLPILTVPIWLLLSKQIKKIKKSFFIAKKQEEINAFYKANQGQMGSNPYQQQSPFGFPFYPKNNSSESKTEENPIETNETNETNEKLKKLKSMTVAQLRKIAEKLSISGSGEMKKAELIKTILLISQSIEEDKKKEKQEIKKDPKPNQEI